MKTIPLKKAYELLENSSGVVIDDNVLVYPSLAEIEDSDENEFLYLSWQDEGLTYSVKFQEGENINVKISGSSMFLTDHEGEETQLSLLSPMALESLV